MRNYLYNLAVTLVGDNSTQVDIPHAAAGTVLKSALNLSYFIAGAVAVIVIIVGAIMYTTSAGNSGSVTKAKNMILYSVVGLIVIVAAFAITNFVIGKF